MDVLITSIGLLPDLIQLGRGFSETSSHGAIDLLGSGEVTFDLRFFIGVNSVACSMRRTVNSVPYPLSWACQAGRRRSRNSHIEPSPGGRRRAGRPSRVSRSLGQITSAADMAAVRSNTRRHYSAGPNHKGSTANEATALHARLAAFDVSGTCTLPKASAPTQLPTHHLHPASPR